MEINVNNSILEYLFIMYLNKVKNIKITSIDKEDFGKVFIISTKYIISIEEDILEDSYHSYTIWWKFYNPLEGKYMTMSNSFTEFELID